MGSSSEATPAAVGHRAAFTAATARTGEADARSGRPQ